jgi:hypothetical protein
VTEATVDKERLTNRDGCDCPPWILRCAHFDGQFINLASSEAFAECHPELKQTPEHKSAWGRVEFGVTVWRDGEHWPHCAACDSINGLLRTPFLITDDLAAAEAFFHETEERLLRGEI